MLALTGFLRGPDHYLTCSLQQSSLLELNHPPAPPPPLLGNLMEEQHFRGSVGFSGFFFFFGEGDGGGGGVVAPARTKV